MGIARPEMSEKEKSDVLEELSTLSPIDEAMEDEEFK